MARLTRLIGGLAALFRRRRIERELDEELRAYLDACIAERMRAGMSQANAVRAARVRMGSLEAVKDYTRDAGWETTAESVGLDTRYALRTLLGSPRFAGVAILMLAIGIGANVAIFTLVDSVLMRALPYRDPGRLVDIDDIYQGRPSGVGQEEFLDWVAQADLFEGLALTDFDATLIRPPGQGDAERIVGQRVSDGFFTVLGARPLHGRAFLPGEDLPGRANVVVLSHALWRRAFGGDPKIVGASITLGDTPHEVVGVMPASFFWVYSMGAAYWRPLGYGSSGRSQHQYAAVGRLKPGVSLEAAQTQMDVLARRGEERYPDAKGWSIRVKPLGHFARAEARTPVLALASAVGLVLLIACANVATLMTVRMVSRSKELAMRAALGATRGRLVRQLLVESALLASMGGGLGVILAVWMLGSVVALLGAGLGLPPSVSLDGRALGFSVALTALTTVLFGLVPAWRTTRLDLVRAFKSSGAGATIDATQQRFLKRVVVAEVALATVLLIAAALLTTSLAQLLSRDLGFSREQILTFHLQPRAAGGAAQRRSGFFDELIERLNVLPGVEAAAATGSLPMSGQYSGSGFEIEGRPSPAEWRRQSAQYCLVTPGYFETMRIGVLRGRGFARGEPTPVVAISDGLARLHWSGEDPVGRRIRGRGSDTWVTIVGVVSDTRYGGPTREPNPTIYVPHGSAAISSMFVAVRLEPGMDSLFPTIRGVIREMDSSAVVTRVAMMDELAVRSVAVQRLFAVLLAAFAAFAVALAVTGIYGVIASSVQQRKQEMGIRLALGAEMAQVRNMVLWQGVRASLLGVGIGIALALGLTRFIASYLFGVTARDPLVFTLTPLLVGAMALVSVWLPARRASRVDPAVALRAE